LKVEEQAHMAQDDEHMLMFAFDVEDPDGIANTYFPMPVDATVNVDDPTSVDTPHHVNLAEAKVFASFDVANYWDSWRWVLDAGATNHMTGCRGVFSDLDKNIANTVHFGDGSIVNIEGRGIILFVCKKRGASHPCKCILHSPPHYEYN
jgi:hypothetical protein